MVLAFIRKGMGVLVSLAAFAALILLAVLTIRRVDLRPRTDDAYLQADIVHMAPDVSGRIVELDVRDNQTVQRDEVLFRIDPVPFHLRVDQAQATVRGLEAKLAVTADQVAAQTSNADTANRGITTAEAQFSLASSTLARMVPLLRPGYVTAEQVDQARTAKQTAEIALQQARLQAQSARKAISSTKPVAEELVYVMQAPQAPVQGAVDSLGGGVAPDEGATFLGLPHVPRSLNWVRIAQRFPLRVLLDHPPAALMRIGASAAIVIDR
jgi:multidrug resistance efflux pump